ncbi:hypothetical protein PF008_g20056 [Phytophthora fragariae]|uniref:Uncharacterized protein n=1 Tax=Phytophthora fragariae TaxID=53985 RepID=A0A6G0R1V1_9STRA|nr:hypothetical protein PF008_g20056 [Phytophthora fragariae]
MKQAGCGLLQCWWLATPVPCLITTVLIDALPLADPLEGVEANSMYFLRSYYTYLVMTFLAIHQFHISVPVLPNILWRNIGSSLVVAAATVGVLYALATVVGFPVPFSLLAVTPAWLLLITLTLTLEWAKKVKETPGAATMLVNSVKLWMCQVLLVFTYPSYFYIFTMLSKGGKTAFAMLLPFLKVFMKNLFARTVVHLRDEMPEVVVFNVELFNALFVSYCMQNSPSLWITLELMGIDIATMVFSLRGAVSTRRSLKDLERRISQRSSWESLDDRSSSVTTRTSTMRRSSTRLTMLDRASMLLHLGQTHTTTMITPMNGFTTVAPTTSLLCEVADNRKMIKSFPNVRGPTHHPIRVAKIFFRRDTIHPAFDADEIGMAKLPVRYTHKVQRLVYAAEFLLLLNYVEVVIPLVFCEYSAHSCVIRCSTDASSAFYLLVMSNLPNRDYYTQLRGMTHFELVQTLRSVQLYCSLQLLSLLVLFLALRHVLGLSPIHQLAYVLEKRFVGVQVKLVFWVYYSVQTSLQHSGTLLPPG